MNEKNVITATNINKTFIDGKRKIEVLTGVDLKVEQGEMVAIVGASGSGKSTLLHILGGLDKPTSGEVLICNKNIHALNQKRQGLLRNKYLGFIYQFHHLLPEFDALENVCMPLLIRKEKLVIAKQQAEEILIQVGLKDRLTHRVGELSGGERQRVAIARALVTNPACVLADEPTGNLDHKIADKIFELILELNNKLAISFLIVTHNLQLAQKMDRVLQLENGVLK